MENNFLKRHPLLLRLLLLTALWTSITSLGPYRLLFAAEPPPVASASSNYVLSGSDVILVKVFQEPDLDSQYRISKDGSINMPLIGTVNIGGKTITDAAALIRDRLAKGYLRNPQVRVNVIQYAPRRFSVLGNVQKPGNYTMGEEISTNLLEAIAMAGGFSKSADLGSVVVRRREGGKETVVEVDARKMGKMHAPPPFQILPGDTIIVGERLF